MRYYTTINNVKASQWGLNIQQAYLFSWIYELPSWASKVMIENEIFYFASKNKAVEELPILTEKTDTMYRYYRQLEDLNLIIIKKIDGKDYIALTQKAKEWNFSKSDYSENNPSKVGNLSENNSDLNPTYNNIIYNNNISNNTNSENQIFSEEELNTEREKRKKVAPKKEINLQEIISIFNEICNKLPRVEKITDKRKKSIENILKIYSIEDIRTVFKNVSQSDFLSGIKTDWSANFDWILNQNNFLKILEGNYNNKPHQDEKQQQTTTYSKKQSYEFDLERAISSSNSSDT